MCGDKDSQDLGLEEDCIVLIYLMIYMLLEEDEKNSIQVLMLFSFELSNILLLVYGDFYIFMIRLIVMLEDKLT